ncbi:MAG: hypothetical protein D6713_05380 [Deltaproteobacteria bacterium]|nr:MAG: hypothetical protein D6713_05380 [Deltaproteobacteria bacterium]
MFPPFPPPFRLFPSPLSPSPQHPPKEEGGNLFLRKDDEVGKDEKGDGNSQEGKVAPRRPGKGNRREDGEKKEDPEGETEESFGYPVHGAPFRRVFLNFTAANTLRRHNA